MATTKQKDAQEWAPWLRARMERGDVGPFARTDTELGITVAIARDPGVDMTTGYVGRFFWSVLWAGNDRSRHGTAPSLIAAEQAIAGAIELGEPPV